MLVCAHALIPLLPPRPRPVEARGGEVRIFASRIDGEGEIRIDG